MDSKTDIIMLGIEIFWEVGVEDYMHSYLSVIFSYIMVDISDAGILQDSEGDERRYIVNLVYDMLFGLIV